MVHIDLSNWTVLHSLLQAVEEPQADESCDSSEDEPAIDLMATRGRASLEARLALRAAFQRSPSALFLAEAARRRYSSGFGAPQLALRVPGTATKNAWPAAAVVDLPPREPTGPRWRHSSRSRAHDPASRAKVEAAVKAD